MQWRRLHAGHQARPGEPLDEGVRDGFEVFDPVHGLRCSRPHRGRQGLEGVQDCRHSGVTDRMRGGGNARGRRRSAPPPRTPPGGARTGPRTPRRLSGSNSHAVPLSTVPSTNSLMPATSQRRPPSPICSASRCQSASPLPGMHHGEIRRRSGRPARPCRLRGPEELQRALPAVHHVRPRQPGPGELREEFGQPRLPLLEGLRRHQLRHELNGSGLQQEPGGPAAAVADHFRRPGRTSAGR